LLGRRRKPVRVLLVGDERVRGGHERHEQARGPSTTDEEPPARVSDAKVGTDRIGASAECERPAFDAGPYRP